MQGSEGWFDSILPQCWAVRVVGGPTQPKKPLRDGGAVFGAKVRIAKPTLCIAALSLLASVAGCLSVLPSNMKQAGEVKAGITNAINEVAEVRNTLTTQVANIQNDVKWWFLGLGVAIIVVASIPILGLVLGFYLVKGWVARYSYVGQFEEIKARKGLS